MFGRRMECCPHLTSLDIGRNNLGQGMSGDVASVLETMLVQEVVPLKVHPCSCHPC